MVGPGTQAVRLLLFADLFSYPRTDLREQLLTVLPQLEQPSVAPGQEGAGGISTTAASLLRDFLAELDALLPTEIEEAYCEFFDVRPACPPYLGHQLFGESEKRGALIAGLAGLYSAHGFPLDGELSDHAAVVLRYLAANSDWGEEEGELLDYCLAPAVAKMAAQCAPVRNPYRLVVAALDRLLNASPPGGAAEGVTR